MVSGSQRKPASPRRWLTGSVVGWYGLLAVSLFQAHREASVHPGPLLPSLLEPGALLPGNSSPHSGRTRLGPRGVCVWGVSDLPWSRGVTSTQRVAGLLSFLRPAQPVPLAPGAARCRITVA